MQIRGNSFLYIFIGIFLCYSYQGYTREFENISIGVPQKAPRCQGINSKGYQCGNTSKRNSTFCDIHDPNRIRCKAIASSTQKQCKNSPSSTCSGYCSVHCDQRVIQ
jgi:hypothetical protein